MNPKIELSVIIPVYNEHENIIETLNVLKKHIHCQHEILIVYDSNEDTTIPVVQSVANQYPEVKLTKNSIGAGPSGALRSGFALAQGEKIAVVMADLCDDISAIPDYLRLIPGKADLISPSRYCRGGMQIIRNVSFFKLWIPRLANLLLRYVVGIPSSDCTNSFKIYSRSLIKDLELKSLISFSVTLEIIVKSHENQYRILDLPTTWIDRQKGKSNFNLVRSIFVYMPWFMRAFFYNRLFAIPKLLKSIFKHKKKINAANERV